MQRGAPLLLMCAMSALTTVEPFSVGAGIASSRFMTPLLGQGAGSPAIGSRRAGGLGAGGLAMQTFSAMRGKPISKSTVVPVDMDFCFEVASDFDQMMNWAKNNGMKKVNVLERDEEGRGCKVELIAKPAFGPEIQNMLMYEFAPPNKIAFRSLSGNVLKTLDGAYTFSKTPRGTSITYELAVSFPGGNAVPGFMQEQITGIIAQTAIFELSKYIKKRAPRR